MLFARNILASLALASTLASGHPGHSVAEEALERRAFLNSVKCSSLAHCASKLKARGVIERNIARRTAQLEKARAKRSIRKRDLETILATDHNKTSMGYTTSTDAATLFAGYNSCLLTPEVTVGPYYVSGEYVREDMSEDQEGLDLVLDYQVIDVDTCEPVPNVYVEIWHCNSTGVYSGVVASGNGDSSDTSNLNNTFLRAIQGTDDDGVAQFNSIFPGHYTGRATHIHVMVHTNATLLANQTLGSDNYASHTGQSFFDQSLIEAVEALEPYASNTQELTENADDSILAEETATDGVDPFLEYTLLGDELSDGLFAWLAFGINTTQSTSITPASFYYESGGVTNSNSNGGGGGGSPPSGSGMPSGGMPSGSGAFGSGIPSSATLASSRTASSSTTSVYVADDSSSSSSSSSSSAAAATTTPPVGYGNGGSAPHTPKLDGATPVVNGSKKSKQTEQAGQAGQVGQNDKSNSKSSCNA
ncbi:hypothetical protein CFIMG_000445RA [Ceratocystis fimbriata CBS 114723]|uniref:Intradiol ring-cleavage dioxygenases domain-containing protein n=1 Tax=Ceratocystis fimbriata CBS 114723 TaxID=1035309 RepID=A0A2C5XJ43_9PEZI|nr:hypothetical protein CFIMG_000445RA [Ceratocystis fimbriata CBS 114723]